MSALSLLKKLKVQTLSFEKHPCRELDQEVMVHYLNGLALITNEDEKVCEKEREYLSILINSFELTEDMLETFVNFAENPDEKLILDMMQSFATKDIKYNLMVDCMMIANIDGRLHENEKAVIEQYFEMFKITKKEAEDLRYIYEMFYTQNGNALYRYFKRNEYMKIELFQYLLDYYEIDMAYELKEDEKKILTFEFFKPTFEKGSLGNGATEIMTKPINNAQFCIYLNSAFMDKIIEIDGNGKVVDSESKNLLMDLNNSDIEFEDGEFIINNAEDEEKKITGVTLLCVIYFIEWISNENIKYSLPHFHVNYHSDQDSDNYIFGSIFNDYPISKEFYYTSAKSKNDEGFRISPKNTVPHFFASNPSKIGGRSSATASFRMMKLPEE
jgi:uncharacterized tellurite resistance protein B-like protein